MSNKIIGIYCGKCFYNHNWDENTLNNKGLGGTETWVVELSKRLQNTYFNYNVIVFCDCEKVHFCNSGVLYAPYTLFDENIKSYHFYALLLLECIGNRIENVSADRIYYTPSCEDITYGFSREDLHMEMIHKVAYLSDWQKQNLKNRYGLHEEQMFRHNYGINLENYDNVDEIEKENLMVWTSSFERGLPFLIERVFPKIKEKIPDFKLCLCCYNKDLKTKSEWFEEGSIYFSGSLSKQELSTLQKKAKIWIYPNYGLNIHNYFFHETFCITALENAISKNAIVCLGNKDGIQTTLDGYSGFIDGNIFNEYDIFYPEDFERLSNVYADKSVEILKNDMYRENLVHETYYIAKNKTWDNAAIDWLKELNEF